MRGLLRTRNSVRWFGAAVAISTCAMLLPSQFASAVSSSSALEFDAPSGLTFGGGHLWVTNESGNSVSEIDPSNGSWIATINANRYGFRQPTAIARDGQDLFVTNANGSVSELRASDGAFVRTISGPRYHFVNPIAIEADGSVVLVLNGGRPNASGVDIGSITEIRASNGSPLRTVSGSAFDFADPLALAVSGSVVFVADKDANAVTEVRVANGHLVRLVAQQGLNTPDGLAVQDGNLWVADSGANGATEISVATGAVISTVTDADGSYGFGSPSVVIGTAGYVYVATPFGSSPMVTKVSATSGQPSWYMCNTNGPYYFSLLSAFAVSGTDLWVASRSGANSKTPAAQTGSLTEMSTGSGALIATFPSPSSSTTTSTSATTTTLP